MTPAVGTGSASRREADQDGGAGLGGAAVEGSRCSSGRQRGTTLAETEDRVLATDIATRWRYNTSSVNAGDLDFNAVYESVKATLLTTFTQGYSKALQHTLYQMAEAVISQHDSIDEIKFSCPNKHHFSYDLSFCGLDNPNEVFYAADRPYGLIEATVQRAGSRTADAAWMGLAGFC